MTHHEPHEPQPPREPHTREREIIVTDRDQGRGVGAVVAAVIGILVILVLGWLLLNGLRAAEEGGADMEVDVPTEFDVNVDDGGGTGGGTDTGGDTGGGTDTGGDAGGGDTSGDA